MSTLLDNLEHVLRYSTHGFGKWHLGFCSDSYTPTKRGFHTFDGLYVGDEADMDPEEEQEGILELARLERAGGRQGMKNIRKSQFFGSKKKSKWKKPERDPKVGPFFNATTQEEFDSLAYAAKAVDLIKNGDESPLFIYLALLTKVYPDGTNQKNNLVQRRLQKVSKYVSFCNSCFIRKTVNQNHETLHFIMNIKVWEMNQGVGKLVTALKNSGR